MDSDYMIGVSGGHSNWPGVTFGEHNFVHPTAKIWPGTKIGSYSLIGPNVQIGRFDYGLGETPVEIGDCTRINEGCTLMAGRLLRIGDWCTLHKNTSILGDGNCHIGHNVWIGQDGYLDCRGLLEIENGVRIGTDVHLWTHVAAGEEIEGCLLRGVGYAKLEHDVWICGDNVTVCMDVVVGHHSVVLPGSMVTKSTEPWKTYGGVPAKQMGKTYWLPPAMDKKLGMMTGWLLDYANQLTQMGQPVERTVAPCFAVINVPGTGYRLVVITSLDTCEGYEYREGDTVFNLTDKCFIKTNSWLERGFYKTICANKARFTPIPANQYWVGV